MGRHPIPQTERRSEGLHTVRLCRQREREQGGDASKQQASCVKVTPFRARPGSTRHTTPLVLDGHS